MQNTVNNVFGSAPESTLAREYLDAQDFSINTLKAVVQDLRKFAVWFSTANNEPFRINRVFICYPIPAQGAVLMQTNRSVWLPVAVVKQNCPARRRLRVYPSQAGNSPRDEGKTYFLEHLKHEVGSRFGG